MNIRDPRQMAPDDFMRTVTAYGRAHDRGRGCVLTLACGHAKYVADLSTTGKIGPAYCDACAREAE